MKKKLSIFERAEAKLAEIKKDKAKIALLEGERKELEDLVNKIENGAQRTTAVAAAPVQSTLTRMILRERGDVSPASSVSNGDELKAELDAIKDPKAATLFYRKHKAAIDATYSKPAGAPNPSVGNARLLLAHSSKVEAKTPAQWSAAIAAISDPTEQSVFFKANRWEIQRSFCLAVNPNVQMPDKPIRSDPRQAR